MRSLIKHAFLRYPKIGALGFRLYEFQSGSNREMRRFFAHLKEKGFSPNVILDVGAHRTQWSHTAKSVFKDARFYLIEPQPEMRPFLEKFCSASKGSKFCLKAAGEFEGEAIFTSLGDMQDGSLLPAPSSAPEKLGQQKQVPITTLDYLVESGWMPLPELVKIDIQGAELRCLEHATKLIGHTEVFILETSFFKILPGQPDFHDVEQFMHNAGYVVYEIMNRLPRPSDGSLGQIDTAFVRTDSPLREPSTVW